MKPRPVGAGTETLGRRLRVLHSVGHLSRGGIEMWLYQMLRRLDADRFEHHVLVWTGDEEAFTAEFRQAGAVVHALPNYTNPVRFARRFRALLRRFGPFDILHTHGTQYHGFVMLLARLCGIKARIAHSHTDIQPVLRAAGRGYRAYAAAGHAAIRSLATAGLAVSELAAVSMFGPAWRTDPRWRIHYCGVDLQPFTAMPDPTLRASLGIPPERRVFGHVGRFETQKNHGFLIEIIAAARALDDTVHFLLIGDGSLHERCVAEIERRGLAAHVTLIRDCRSVPLHMVSAMDGFVLPSLYEGLALVAVEAQAAGLACLLSDGLGEAVALRDRTRLLPLDAGASDWAKALLSLPPRLDSRDPVVCRALTEAGFSIAQSAARLMSIYEYAVSASRLPPAEPSRPPVLFVAHPSDLLTDHLPNGDGLIAYGFLSELLRRGYRIHIATRGTALRAPLPENAVMHPVPRRFRSEPFDRLHYMWAIRRMLRRLRRSERIDLVHQMNPVFAGLSLGLLGCGLPIVLGTYVARWPGGEAYDYGSNALRAKIKAMGRWTINLLHQSRAAALLITTPAAMNRIPLARFSRRRSHLVRHGIDTMLFAPEAGWRQAARLCPPTILFYSHLDRRKGVFVLVDAFKAIARAMPEARLLLVGRGDHTEELGEYVRNSGCANRIEIRGPVQREQAPALLWECSVYCLPSFGEPYATTVLEAMACAKPVVVTKAGGLPYMVSPQGGACVPTGDAQALAAALLDILGSADRQVAMGEANRAYIEEHFTWARVVDSLERVYRHVAARSPATCPEPAE